MSTFTVSIHLNLRPETAGAVIDTVGPALAEAGLSFRSDAPGLIEGRGVSGEQLAMLLERVSSLVYTPAGGAMTLASGVVDDLWVHVRRER